MPKTATDYSKNIIYKIQHNDDDSLLYVGHTTNFIKRKSLHKYHCETHPSPVYKMIRDNGGWNCFTMIVIQNFPCETKMEARIEEDRMMREMKASMNTRRAFTSPQERKDYMKEYKKEYYQSNREVINEKLKDYYRANKEQICEYKREYHQVNKEQIHEKKKEYHQANKEHICEKAKDYRLANRDKINEKQREKVECVCGCLIVKSTLTRHMNTKRHLNNLK
jgi:hypothetical protein